MVTSQVLKKCKPRRNVRGHSWIRTSGPMNVERALYHCECLKALDCGSGSVTRTPTPHLVKWVKVSAYLIVSAREKSARRSLLDFDREFTDTWVAQLGSGVEGLRPGPGPSEHGKQDETNFISTSDAIWDRQKTSTGPLLARSLGVGGEVNHSVSRHFSAKSGN